MYGLIDCNNFYVSCERIFRPELQHKPVVVLSNNDGCVISRSAEVKALGIPMGVPLFQIEGMVKRYGIEVCSSNFTLYGDISRRVMSLIREHVDAQEIYSIDECFVIYDDKDDYEHMGAVLRHDILRGVGVPVCVGLAPTKTLAKMANRLAKKNPEYKGVYAINTDERRLDALARTDIDDVWGIGRRYARRLHLYGVKNALDFTERDPRWVRREMTIVGLRTYNELLGDPELEFNPADQIKSISRSRSFPEMINDKTKLQHILMDFTDTCCTRLREQQLGARKVMVFMGTNRFREDLPQSHEYAEAKLISATHDVSELSPIIQVLLDKVYHDGYDYKRAGVVLSELVPPQHFVDMFDEIDRDKQARFNNALDSIRAKFGREALTIGTEDRATVSEITRREHTSRAYTTKLSDIIEVKA